MANVHHATRKAADKDLSEGAITEQAHAAVIAGMMTLQEARNIGTGDAHTDTPEGAAVQDEGQETPGGSSTENHQDTPPQPVSRISKDDTRQECWCGCGQLTKPNRRWLPGHDQRAKGIIKRVVREGKVDELDARLKEYGQERGML
jgi:hypothetical protein